MSLVQTATWFLFLNLHLLLEYKDIDGVHATFCVLPLLSSFEKEQ